MVWLINYVYVGQQGENSFFSDFNLLRFGVGCFDAPMRWLKRASTSLLMYKLGWLAILR
jgi:hypothetical protein